MQLKQLMIWASLLLGLSPGAMPQPTHHKPAHKVKAVAASDALKRLLEGNRRFATHHMKHPDETVARRLNLARHGQHPFAIVLSCADSRLPPEIIFDVGLGDLFVIRVAGNIADDAVIASIEYAAEHLGARLLMVLGHENCGAIHAAITNQTEGHLATLVTAIQPALTQVRQQQRTGKLAEESERFHDQVGQANVDDVCARLRTSEPLLAHLVAEKKLVIKGAYYHLASGKVSLLHH